MAIGAVAAAQNQSASVAGVVLDESGRPVARATVAVMAAIADKEPVGETTADDRGAFTIRGLPAGQFSIVGAKPGYVDVRSSSRQTIPNVTLSAGTRAAVTVRLQTGGVISGTVVDRDGTPADGVLVAIEGRLNQFGRMIGSTTQARSTTNSRGEYRLFGLAAGSYIVGAFHPLAFQGALVTGDGTAESYFSQFYPDALNPNAAAPVTIAAGEERSGVDFKLRTTAVSRVDVNLVVAQGTPIARGRGICSPIGPTGDLGRLTIDSVKVDGDRAELTCPAVAAGPHTILVAATPRAGPEPGSEPVEVWGSSEVFSSGKPVEVTITLYPGERITGRAAVDAAAGSPAPLSTFFIQLEVVDGPFKPLLDGNVDGATPSDNGEFSFDSVPPGRYRLTLDRPDGWTLAAATLDGRDVLDLPFDLAAPWASDLRVTLSNALTRLSGRVQTARGSPAGQAVIVFPADQRYWLPGTRRIQAGRSDLTGRYEFRGLPPGTYHLAVDSSGLFDEEWDSAVLLQLSRSARRIVLGSGQALVQDLTVR